MRTKKKTTMKRRMLTMLPLKKATRQLSELWGFFEVFIAIPCYQFCPWKLT